MFPGGGGGGGQRKCTLGTNGLIILLIFISGLIFCHLIFWSFGVTSDFLSWHLGTALFI